MTTFNPSVAPSVGLSVSTKANVKRLSFGDGYSQRTPEGLNHISREISLSWPVLTNSEALALESFFVSQGGVNMFYYTLPGEASAKKWTCAEWEKTYLDGPYFSFTAKLKEEFDLA
jgi:phage-related protein